MTKTKTVSPAAPSKPSAQEAALENIRLYAARHRKEPWAAVVLRFCAEGGATGTPLRIRTS